MRVDWVNEQLSADWKSEHTLDMQAELFQAHAKGAP